MSPSRAGGGVFIAAVALLALPFRFIFFQITVLQRDKSLLSVALSGCCSFPFSSSVACSFIFLSSVRWGKKYVQIQARSTADKAHSLSCFY